MTNFKLANLMLSTLDARDNLNDWDADELHDKAVWVNHCRMNRGIPTAFPELDYSKGLPYKS